MRCSHSRSTSVLACGRLLASMHIQMPHIYTHTYTYTHVHIHILVHIHARTHARTHAHTQDEVYNHLQHMLNHRARPSLFRQALLPHPTASGGLAQAQPVWCTTDSPSGPHLFSYSSAGAPQLKDDNVSCRYLLLPGTKIGETQHV